MNGVWLAIPTTLLLWWGATIAVLFLVGLRERTRPWLMAAATLGAAIGFAGLWSTSQATGPAGAYAAFVCAMLIWAWNEVAFLAGYVAGPRKTACPPAAVGVSRFILATRSVIHHEAMIALSALAIAALTWGEPNMVGVWTFGALALMRLSTKINLFLGVPNTAEELLPPRLSYLASYFGPKRINPVFPASVTATTLATALVAQAAWRAPAESVEATGLALVATLMALAVVEHWFLALPLDAEAMWRWGLASRRKTAKDERSEPPPAIAELIVPTLRSDWSKRAPYRGARP